MIVGVDDGNTERRIGRYRLIRQIGEGGMGTVWRAVQEHPVKRDVALKLVRKDLGMDALARFEAERQAIAMMDHPNIAKILDADSTEEGSPYFVMELVKGIPLDQFCNNHKFGIAKRLQLMLSVCRAVQHAHQKSILHRDLKHSNILVGENDGEPAPKVIDFGLAKALGSQKSLTDKTVFTEFGKVVGTIYYMSPEQADSDGMDIDTRSDIYSLGVVLYKLLTGNTPIQIEGDGLSVFGAIKAIQDKDPVAPSIAVRKNDVCGEWVKECAPLNRERHADQLKGDLDSIVLKALEKDRRKRYETASGLALDIERYLNQEPVLAQPRNSVYTIRKFVQRNRGLVASLATIAALLVVGIVATSLSLMFALSETERANASAEFAKLETERARTTEKLRTVQLKAQLNKNAWSDFQRNNVKMAWQSLRQAQKINPENPDWVGRYLSNEMNSCKPENMLRGGHAHYVLTADISSQDDYVLSGGADDTVYLWDANTKEKLYRHICDDIVICVRFSSDQKQFAVADRSNVISVFETSTGNLVRKLGPFEQDVSSLCFHPKMPILAYGFYGNDSARVERGRDYKFAKNKPADLAFVNIDSGEILQTIEGHQNEITSLMFDETGRRLVSSCHDGVVRIFEWESKTDDSDSKINYTLKREINAHPSGINKLDLSLNGTVIACCGKDKVASIWNADTGELIMNLAGHKRDVLGVAVSPAGDLVATGSSDDTAIVWNLKGEQIVTWRGHDGPINEICFTGDGDQIVTASDDQTLRFWNTQRSATTVSYRFEFPHEIWQADFSPDKETVAVASEQGSAFLIDIRTGKLKKTLPHGEPVLGLEWLSDGRLITAGEKVGLQVWDRLDRTGDVVKPIRKIDFPESIIWDVSVSPNEDRIIIASNDKTARVFDSKTLEELGVLRGHDDGLAAARFSSDGNLIATACDDGSIGIWNADTYKLLYFLNEHKHSVWRTVFSPTDSNLMASCASNGRILLWDLEAKQPFPVTIQGHEDTIAGLAFTPDGRSLVSASDDASIRFWDVETGVELFVLHNQMAEYAIHASFSRDGKTLVTSCDGIVDIRHASTGFASPYLNGDAIADMIDIEERIAKEDVSDEELEKIASIAKKINGTYPSWDAHEVLGVAQFRLGRFADAIGSLEEALRLEKIILDSPETRLPISEGYLALALAKAGKLDGAREMKVVLDLFIEKHCKESVEALQLQSRVSAAIPD